MFLVKSTDHLRFVLKLHHGCTWKLRIHSIVRFKQFLYQRQSSVWCDLKKSVFGCLTWKQECILLDFEHVFVYHLTSAVLRIPEDLGRISQTIWSLRFFSRNVWRCLCIVTFCFVKKNPDLEWRHSQGKSSCISLRFSIHCHQIDQFVPFWF